jgi:hypothetical protein
VGGGSVRKADKPLQRRAASLQMGKGSKEKTEQNLKG